LNPNKIPGGGGTKFGITQRNWDGYCMRNKMPLSPVLKITREQAEKVGFVDYKRSGAQILPPNTQIAVADFHFNGGPGNMIIVLRDILKLPPIRVQGLKRDAMVQLIKEQKKLLYPMIVKLIKNQEQD
jgi:lysozyme family protein